MRSLDQEKLLNEDVVSKQGFKEMVEDSFITSRRRARTVAFQVLYEVDSVDHPWDQVSSRYLKEECFPREAVSFSRDLIEGVTTHSERIDAIIFAFAPSWPVPQLPVVDRNLLRLAIYELLIEVTSPPKVVINETIELAKRFGSDNSFRFINGVLGSLMQTKKSSSG